jgi:ATP-dependent exoDNAse (exonuclease V) beta subunit
MNIVFNASAGTGKTWQVTELYAALVLGREHPHLGERKEPVRPENILLMTFTDNAASELRERVAGKMMAAEEEGDADVSDLARGILRHLPASNISTIHAFCAGLLREHALALGLSPQFQTLEDEERDELLDEVLKAEMFQTLENDLNFREFCSGISVLGGEYSLLGTIRMLLEKADSRGLDLANAAAMLPAPTQTVGRADFERLHDELVGFGLTQKTVLDAQDALACCLADFPNGMDGLKKFGRVKAVKHLSDELFELKERFLTESLYAEHIEPFRSFARCLARCARSFSEAKRARDAVDFGDQLLMARDLLKSASFETPAFEWIIVDEVQDTSRVQCDVIEALWGPQSNLVICGDKKQSIYAWRSADPKVMPDLEEGMVARGATKTIPLKKSYRSKDRVIDAVNELFEGLYEGSYDALESQGTLEGEKPCVEFLAADDEEQRSEEEMAAVARRIQLLVNGGSAWRPNYGHDGETFVEGAQVNYGDILILLKRSTHQAALEKALRDAGIPWSSGGKGRALFEQQEVRDILLLLQAVVQPENDLALVGLMRSPFMNCSDDEIVRFGWDGTTFDHETLRRQFLETEAAELLLRLRVDSGRVPISQWVREAVRETAFDAQLAGQPGGEQKLANFKKVLDWLRAVERGGQVLPGDVVRRFEKAIKTPPKSGAAEALLPDPHQNAVTIMTVHGAKGLTKRVCFVPDISFGDQSDKGFALFSQDTLELKLTSLSGGDVKSPGWDAVRAADKEVRLAESLNVFYVAMTRARDLVVLSGSGTSRVDGWLKMAERFLESARPEILKKYSFGEIPPAGDRRAEIGGQRSEVGGQRSEVGGQASEVHFRPLEIPMGFDRRPVTSLCEKQRFFGNRQSAAGDRRLFGTLGHAVLEELTKSGWAGDIRAWVELHGSGFEQADELIGTLEMVRAVLQRETAGAKALFAEFPFVLKRGELILDGTMDLLVELQGAWKVFDYKFSNEPPEHALETYGPQLAAYKEAVGKLHPGESVSAALVLIGESVQVVEA